MSLGCFRATLAIAVAFAFYPHPHPLPARGRGARSRSPYTSLIDATLYRRFFDTVAYISSDAWMTLEFIS
jgi:hypothetical protein